MSSNQSQFYEFKWTGYVQSNKEQWKFSVTTISDTKENAREELTTMLIRATELVGFNISTPDQDSYAELCNELNTTITVPYDSHRQTEFAPEVMKNCHSETMVLGEYRLGSNQEPMQLYDFIQTTEPSVKKLHRSTIYVNV